MGEDLGVSLEHSHPEGKGRDPGLPPPLAIEDKVAILVLGIAIHRGEKDQLVLSGEEKDKWFLQLIEVSKVNLVKCFECLCTGP